MCVGGCVWVGVVCVCVCCWECVGGCGVCVCVGVCVWVVCVCVGGWVAADIAQLIEGLARGWTVRHSNLVGARFHTHPEPSRVLNNGYRGSFSRVRQPRPGVEHIPPSAERKNV